MNLPTDFSQESADQLSSLSFKLIDSSDNGMMNYYLWQNQKMQFALTYDRGYYDCEIIPTKKPITGMGLVRLLKFLKSDKTFYNKELKEVNLFRTLPTAGYVKVFNENYNLIEVFLAAYGPEAYFNFSKFEFDYDEIQ